MTLDKGLADKEEDLPRSIPLGNLLVQISCSSHNCSINICIYTVYIYTYFIYIINPFPLILNNSHKRELSRGFAYIWDHLGGEKKIGGWDYSWLVGPPHSCHSHQPRPSGAPQPTLRHHLKVATPAMEKGLPPGQHFQPGQG